MLHPPCPLRLRTGGAQEGILFLKSKNNFKSIIVRLQMSLSVSLIPALLKMKCPRCRQGKVFKDPNP